MDVPVLEAPKRESGPQIRLMLCRVCKVIEELPDFEGNPDDDTLLQLAIEKHTDSFGTPHVGNLFKVPVRHWADSSVRQEIVKQIMQGISGGIDEVEKGFYDTRSMFFEDAMTCFRQHNRPKGRCPDWKADSKKLVPKTAAERKDAGLQAPSKAPVHTFLCQFCPVNTFMVTKAREQAGQYK